MTKYLLSVHTGADDSPASMTEEPAREGYARINSLEQDMEAAGALVFSGRLDAPDSARVVQAGNGKVTTTDGPYLEAKEAIGGFYIVEAPSLDDAMAWASKTSAAIGMPIEVRPFFDSRQPEGG
jgi:hypothetical protein